MKKRSLFKEGDGIVYHYTSLDTFLKILDGFKYEYIIFHGTDIFSMNDPTEFVQGFIDLWTLLPQIEDTLYRHIKEAPHDYNIKMNLLDDKYRVSNMWKIMGGDDESWLKAHVEAMHQSYNTPFVVSFSCHADYLPMWTTYGDDGKGVAIGVEVQDFFKRIQLEDGSFYFDFTKIDTNEYRSLLVSYDKITINSILAKYAWFQIRNYLEEISAIDFDNDSLLLYQSKALDNIVQISAALNKNEAYRYEKEARLISFKQDIREVKFKVSMKKNLLPYIRIGIPVNRLKRIIMGPCCDESSVKNALRVRYKQLGIPFDEECIVKSEIPYRAL